MSCPTKTSPKFDRKYYTGRNYRNYLTRKFDHLASDIIDATGLLPPHRIVDFGCGYGGLVNSMWQLGYRNIYGTDISQWSVEHGHAVYPHLLDRLQFYNRDILRSENQAVILLDVLEHMPEYEVESVLKLARQGAKKWLVVRIPVSDKEGSQFVLDVSNNDPTHICCHTKRWWDRKISAAGFRAAIQFDESTIYDSAGVLAAAYQ